MRKNTSIFVDKPDLSRLDMFGAYLECDAVLRNRMKFLSKDPKYMLFSTSVEHSLLI